MMELALQRIIDGLGNGGSYAALALALVLIFKTTGLLNLCQGELATVSVFVVWAIHNAGVPIWIAVVIGLAFSFFFGAAVERVFIRPVHHREHLTVVIVTVGLFVLLNSVVGLVFGHDGRQLEGLFPSGAINVRGAVLPLATLCVWAVLLIVLGALWLLLYRSKLGLGLRGVASNTESSALVGVPVSRLLTVGWGLAAALGCVSGVLITTTVFVEPTMMFGVLIYAFAAALLGGLDSIPGAVVGGLVVGVSESLVGGYFTWIGSDLKMATAFLLIIAVLLLRPNGLFGRPEAQRV